MASLAADTHTEECRPQALLTVTVNRAKDLKAADFGGTSDPYALVVLLHTHAVPVRRCRVCVALVYGCSVVAHP